MATKQEESEEVKAATKQRESEYVMADELLDMYRRMTPTDRRQISDRGIFFRTMWFKLSEPLRNHIGIMYLQHKFEMNAAIGDFVAEDRDSEDHEDSESDSEEEAATKKEEEVSVKKEVNVEQDVDNGNKESKVDLMEIDTFKQEDFEARGSALQNSKAETKMEEDSQGPDTKS